MAERSHIQVLGLCRFSYPAELDGFQTRHETMADRLDYLYSPERLATRMFWFEHILLPSIRSQTTSEFTLLLLLGEDFPEPWRSRLLELVADVPQIRPVFRPTGPHRLIYREVMLSARDADAKVVAEFRLDDDDAVAVNYVQMIRRMFTQLRPLFQAKGRLALDQGKGVLIEANGNEISYRPLLSHCWAPALTLYLRPQDSGCVTDFPHQKVWQRMPLVSQTDQVMFLRGAHATNDSPVTVAGTHPAKMDAGEIPDLIARRFGVDCATFEAGWADLNKRL